jgi:6-phosphogluconate dehydrogenase
MRKSFSLTHEANPQHRIKATIDERVCRTYKTATGNYVTCAGKPVDTAIESLPYLDKGDILIDGGNTYFTDTDRRFTALSAKGIHFWNGYLGEKEHDLVLVCLAVIKKPMKGYAPIFESQQS